MELGKIMVLMHQPMEDLEVVEEVCIIKIKVPEEEVDTPVDQAAMTLILAHLVLPMAVAVVPTTLELTNITKPV